MSWTWAAASQIGTSHVRNGMPCQDRHRCFESNGTIVAIVSDGAGSALEGAKGAALVCRTLASELSSIISKRWPTDVDITEMVDQVRDRIAHVALSRGLLPRDFAATSVAVIAGEHESIAVHVGDGAAVGSAGSGWESLSWPDSGEFAGTTYFVTDDAGARLRISRSSQRLDAIAVFTDGIERLALDFAQSKPFAPFFDGMMRPLAGVQIQGRSSAISEKLGSFLASETVNSRTDDDKTLILARRL